MAKKKKIKLKTCKRMLKSIKITGTGKIMHRKAGKNHLIVRKGKKTRIDKSGRELLGANIKKAKRLLPYI